MQLSQLERNFKKWIPFFGQLSFDDHEQIVFCNKDTGLKAIIGIHNSVMGPALGELECLIMLMNGLP
jgi:glutamate dehydrogenase/leucine dehydrogenase